MAICKHCGAETQLYFNTIPICLACVDALDAKSESILSKGQLGLPQGVSGEISSS
jgi:hypothetical protein